MSFFFFFFFFFPRWKQNVKLQIRGSYLLNPAADSCFDWLCVPLEEKQLMLCVFAAAARRQPLNLDADRKQDTALKLV